MRYTNSKYCIAVNFTSPSFLVRFSVLAERAFILRSRMRGKPFPVCRETDASNFDDRSARDSEERRNKVEKVESQRDAIASPLFSFGALYLYFIHIPHLSLVGIVYIEWNFFRIFFCIMSHRLSTGLVRQGLYGGMR